MVSITIFKSFQALNKMDDKAGYTLPSQTKSSYYINYFSPQMFFYFYFYRF